ncbi:hemin uptake protein HemP [Rubripirellula reticaptiva]|uniref:hemin uptake protein HemP n=1 Tax=Rubripirellula reticaptiva TaxID=2528013 RepID=UPI0011B4F605|nr:hemin uptake protein HemP [Rubripirellula reticaptiva]
MPESEKPDDPCKIEESSKTLDCSGRSDHSGQDPLFISSQEILRGRREVWIDHAGDVYRLRLTSSGKLYLSK